MRILTFTNHYLPGWKAGGATRAVANVIAQFHDEHEFFVVTLDHDQGEDAPYPGLITFTWREIFDCRVCYVPGRSLSNVSRAIAGVDPDLVWLNSYFSPFTAAYLSLRRMGRAYPDVPVLLAPRGEVSAHTLALKAGKKDLYRKTSRIAGLYRGLKYHATSPQEVESIAEFALRPSIFLAPDLLPPPIAQQETTLSKRPGELRLTFISRIDQKKNLKFLLQVMAQSEIAFSISLDIYGAATAVDYWSECRRIIDTLPAGCVRYHGAIEHSKVLATLTQAHFFVLPTLDENFGYAIAESWQAARPVIISQGTPWRNLAAQEVGFDLPLNAYAWSETLRGCIAMDDAPWRHLCGRAHEFYTRLTALSPERVKTAEMFAEVARTRTPR